MNIIIADLHRCRQDEYEIITTGICAEYSGSEDPIGKTSSPFASLLITMRACNHHSQKNCDAKITFMYLVSHFIRCACFHIKCAVPSQSYCDWRRIFIKQTSFIIHLTKILRPILKPHFSLDIEWRQRKQSNPALITLLCYIQSYSHSRWINKRYKISCNYYKYLLQWKTCT